MYSGWFRSTFLRNSKLLQIKERVPNISEEPILQKVWIICSTLLYFNFKSFKCEILRHSLDFNSFCLIQEYWSQTFEISTNYRGVIKFAGENNSAESLNYLVFILCLNFKTFKDPNSWLCIRFQCVLHDSVERL